MATHDVPGFGTAKNDKLGMGCWAESDDGSLIFVLDTEDAPGVGSRVIYEVYDLSVKPVMKYTDAMPKAGFERQFSWTAEGKKTSRDQWSWHNRTPLPWNRIIEAGVPNGSQYATADGLISAAQRVAASRDLLRGQPVNPDDIRHRAELKSHPAIRRMAQGIQSAISRLRP